MSSTENVKRWAAAFLKDKYNIAFLIILFLALQIRLKYFWQESIWNDSAFHLWTVEKAFNDLSFLFSFDFYIGDHGINQLLTLFFRFFTENVFFAGKLSALMQGLVGIIFIYCLGTELKGKISGLIAATLLSFHHLFWFFNNRLTADASMTTSVIFILYCFTKLQKRKSTFWAVMTGVSFLISILAKFQAAHLFIILLVYYIFFDRRSLTKKPYIYSWLIPTSGFLAVSFFSWIMGTEGIFLRVFKLFVTLRGMPFGLDTTTMFPWIFTWYLLAFAALGSVLVLLYKKKEYYFPLFFFLFYWIFSEVGLDQPDARHLLFMVPILLLFAAFAIEEIAIFLSVFSRRNVVKYALVIIIVFLISWNTYKLGDAFIYGKSLGYTGYQEAGQWLKENVPDGTPIFAGSPRSIRAFVGREWYSFGEQDPSKDTFFGGSVWYLRGTKYLENRSAFEEDVAHLSKVSDIYLEIDIWEYTQARWYWPIRQESIDYFLSKGFQFVKVVEREVSTQDGFKKIPVIFIFKKEKENATFT